MLLSYFTKKCTHENLSYSTECGYCPDCGAYVETRWYLVRCSCCGLKRVAISRGNEILPASYYCKNCGETHYYIEELKKLNFVDINYATALKVEPTPIKQDLTQSWVQSNTSQIELLTVAG